MKKIFTILFVINQFVVFGQLDSLKILRHFGPDYSKTIYPTNDSITYNQYVGETVAGYTIADGWRKDTINGGFNKEIYRNPYIQDLRFVKQKGEEMRAYRYKNGKLFNGGVIDTLTVSFTPNKIVGYLYGNHYKKLINGKR